MVTGGSHCLGPAASSAVLSVFGAAASKSKDPSVAANKRRIEPSAGLVKSCLEVKSLLPEDQYTL